VAVEAVIEGSPAAQAGIQADDTLLAIGPAQFAPADPRAKASTAALIKAAAQVAALPPDLPLEIRGVRDGVGYTRTVAPIPACRTRFEVVIESGFEAQADGEMVQLSSRFLYDYPEDQVAAAMAHELAHNVLHHRERLEAQGVSYGLLAGLGRNVRYFRQTEIEADILSVSLLANAGYDPNAAVRFWSDFGPKHASGILLSRSHPAWRDRLATIKRTVAALGDERRYLPTVLESRESALSGDWQSLLVKAR
jgi:Zn-dependent protease with chaperone function